VTARAAKGLRPASTSFVRPERLIATEPAEVRGVARDEVRLLVATAGTVTHTTFRSIAGRLSPGDLVVVNTSATAAAALSGTRSDGREVAVHVSGPLPDHLYAVELRCLDGSCRVLDGRVGEAIRLAGGGALTLQAAYPGRAVTTGSRLWRGAFTLAAAVPEHLARHGRPISYGHGSRRWPLAAYQTVFAQPTPWMPSAEMPSAEMPSAEMPSAEMPSAEMPSAGRPFTDRVVTSLVVAGVQVAPVTLHTGVSSLEADEQPMPERFSVPATTARLVNQTLASGGRIVAVGTTVTRALETVAASDGTLHAASGWTDLVLGPDRPTRAVTGLVTGWHDPRASHLLLLEAVAGAPLVQRAYDEAVAVGYLWHEFGDSALLLP